MRNTWIFCWIFLISCESTKPEIEIDTTEKVDENIALVSVRKTKKQSFHHFYKVQGSVISKKIAFIRPEINGVVDDIFIQEGDFVKKNQKLISISTKILNSQLSELEQQFSFAQYLFEKQRDLFQDGVATEIQFKEAENNLLRIEKSKNTLIAQIEKSIIYAPFDGYIEEVMIQTGESSNPMNPIFHIVGINDLFIKADISEQLLSEVNLEDRVSVFFPSINEELTNLKLTRIGKIVNPSNRTVKVEAKIPNPSKNLIPNLMGEISINDYTNDSAICLSSRLILKNSSGGTFVKSIDKANNVFVIPVKVGKQEGGLVEIISNLEVGALVIDQGKSSVLEGQKVKVIEEKL